jgi:hypothetical protein
MLEPVTGARSCRVTAKLFGVSIVAVVRWLQHFRATGSSDPGNGRAIAAPPDQQTRVAAGADGAEARPDAAGADGRAGCSYCTVWALFAHEGNVHANGRDLADIARRRGWWKKYQGQFDTKRLILIDEPWAKANTTRQHGRRARGTRSTVAIRRRRTLTFLAMLRCDRTRRLTSS